MYKSLQCYAQASSRVTEQHSSGATVPSLPLLLQLTGTSLQSISVVWPLQGWLAANHSLEETQAEMARLQNLAEAAMNIAEPKVTFRLIQVPCIHSHRAAFTGQFSYCLCTHCPVWLIAPSRQNMDSTLQCTLYIAC